MATMSEEEEKDMMALLDWGELLAFECLEPHPGDHTCHELAGHDTNHRCPCSEEWRP